jgi:sugar phosphate isomerase/epimerase
MGFSVEVKKNGATFSSKFPWRLGVVFFMAYPSLQKNEDELEKGLKFITQDGFFDRLEVNKISENGWEKIEKYAQGMNIARGFQPDLLLGTRNICTPDESKRRETLNYLKNEIDIGLKHGVREFAICSGQMPEDVAKGNRQLVASLKELGEYASKYKASFSLETFDIDKDKKQLVGPIDKAAELIKEVRKSCDNVFIMWDQSHAPLLGETYEVIKKYSNLLGVVHLGCGLQTPEGLKDWHPVYHTKGAINDEGDLAHLLKTLLEISYRGPVTVEVKPQEGQTSEEIVNSAKGAIYAAYSMVAKDLF